MTPAREATAIAHPNIALAKYWGKMDGEGNVPAVPSLSVTLSGMQTKTRVVFSDALERDALSLNGREASGEPLVRVSALLDRVRAMAKLRSFAEVESHNDFPTASGLASSASGFAALALAATRAAGLDSSSAAVSELARRSSASAARSVFGGFVQLEGTACSVVAPVNQLDLHVLVCVTTEGAKAVGSTSAMNETRTSSPYYAAWLAEAPRIFGDLRQALLAKNFALVGALAEKSAFAMHACALGAGISFFNQGTLEVLASVRALRASSVQAFATMDAGPHVKVLVLESDRARAERSLVSVPGVLRVLHTQPGEGARIL
ncbi:MAG: diphosphomevalonate decarboxylase [Polyangiaceae bacterium]